MLVFIVGWGFCWACSKETNGEQEGEESSCMSLLFVLMFRLMSQIPSSHLQMMIFPLQLFLERRRQRNQRHRIRSAKRILSRTTILLTIKRILCYFVTCFFEAVLFWLHLPMKGFQRWCYVLLLGIITVYSSLRICYFYHLDFVSNNLLLYAYSKYGFMIN